MADVSAGELAAFAIETWRGLGGSADAPQRPSRRGVTFYDADSAAARVSELEKEANALRMMLTQERSRIVREVRSLRVGWESADGRARGLEGQTLMLRCSEATLTRELAHADQLTDWWRHTDRERRNLTERLQGELKTALQNATRLEGELAKCVTLHPPARTTPHPHTCMPRRWRDDERTWRSASNERLTFA